MKIGDEVYVHGYVDEIRTDAVIIRNMGGYFGTSINEIKPSDEDVGKACYKIYITAERHRFPNTYWDYFCDTVHCLEFWRKQIMYGNKATLYVKERPFTKSDRNKLGKTVFWTEQEAWQAIGLGYAEQTETSSSEIPNSSTISKMEQVDKDDAYFLELMGAVARGEISDAGANQAWYEYINHKDEPQTERSE